MHGIGRKAALVAGSGVLGLAAALLSPGAAHATELTCTAPAGPGLVEDVRTDGDAACGARVDELSRALSRAIDGVAFSRADLGGTAVSLAHSGGVAAAETESGGVGAVSIGAESVSIISADPGALALAMSLTRGQTFVGTVEEGVRCDAGIGVAINVTTGQLCLSDGVNSWATHLGLP